MYIHIEMHYICFLMITVGEAILEIELYDILSCFNQSTASRAPCWICMKCFHVSIKHQFKDSLQSSRLDSNEN